MSCQGSDPQDDALRTAVRAVQDIGQLFVTAAGDALAWPSPTDSPQAAGHAPTRAALSQQQSVLDSKGFVRLAWIPVLELRKRGSVGILAAALALRMVFEALRRPTAAAAVLLITRPPTLALKGKKRGCPATCRPHRLRVLDREKTPTVELIKILAF